MTGPSAKIIADSISPEGVRLTTMELCFHRFVLAEFNTHRVFSRNSASSRAIPLAKMVKRAEEDTAYPLSWPAEQSGMQGGEELSEDMRSRSAFVWEQAMQEAVISAHLLGENGVHKSVANRLLEPFQWHTAVVTATAWENFFDQRVSPLAQPEIRKVAEHAYVHYQASKPIRLERGDWHLPYMTSEDETDSSINLETAVKISAARCARVSYLTQDGKREIEKDLELYERLVTAKPRHWSPLEHVATPWPENRQATDLGFQTVTGEWATAPTNHLPMTGNLLGWRTLRTEVESTLKEVTFR